MEPTDPHKDKTYTLRLTAEDDGVRETETTAGQALDFAAGKPVSYAVRDEQVLVDDDGTIIKRESAVPQRRDA